MKAWCHYCILISLQVVCQTLEMTIKILVVIFTMMHVWHQQSLIRAFGAVRSLTLQSNIKLQCKVGQTHCTTHLPEESFSHVKGNFIYHNINLHVLVYYTHIYSCLTRGPGVLRSNLDQPHNSRGDWACDI